MKITTEFEKSAIIGFWRMGASLKEISGAIKKPMYEVDFVIENFKANHPDYYKYINSL